MQTLDPSFYLAAGGVVLAGIVWALRLEGRVNTADARFIDLKANVEYIRNRIDEALDK